MPGLLSTVHMAVTFNPFAGAASTVRRGPYFTTRRPPLDNIVNTIGKPSGFKRRGI